jgi:hypothetical protein
LRYRWPCCKSVSKFGKNSRSCVVFLLRRTLNRSGRGTDVEGKGTAPNQFSRRHAYCVLTAFS